MTDTWIVRDSNGRLLSDFSGSSRLDVGRKVVPGPTDAFRLHVSASYRALFDRALAQILAERGWEIVRTRAAARRAASIRTPVLAH